MSPRAPQTRLATHEVTNQPPPFEDINLFRADAALRGAVAWAGADATALEVFGESTGSAVVQENARLANENPPKLRAFDRYGQRLDEVEFHPAYHALMALGFDSGIAAAPLDGAPHGHLRHGAMMILMNQADAGVTCPMSMTYAATAALPANAALAADWLPRIAAARYDARFIPAPEKAGVTLGMAMTEKQGGSDVRANTTHADPDGDDWRLTGHKWFCSAPMSDAFLTLAHTTAGLTCFLVPRWRPDGSRNAIHIMRLKDKMGDRSNASSEIEYHGAWAQKLGEEGHGVRTIIAMVQHTRYDCALGSAGGMRAALSQALWHAQHRRAFQKRLIDHAAMRAVLADLAIESAAATCLALRIGTAFDRGEDAFSRLATPVAKFWICKRQPGFVAEALECLGGAGFVEESPMPRLFRQSPLNAVWEGSGNVIALDILRAVARSPDSLQAVQNEIAVAQGANDAFDRFVAALPRPSDDEGAARGFAVGLALALQGAALFQMGDRAMFDAFCATRLGRGPGLYGNLGAVDPGPLIEQAMPQV